MVTPLITAIIPSYNEEKNIEKCLQAVFKSFYPKKKIQILVVDGGSNDTTLKKVEKFKRKKLSITILHNKKQHLASAWNIGIKNAKGKYIFAMNAHAVVHPRYFYTITLRLEKRDVVCCGSSMITRPQEKGPWSMAIATALSSKAGVGNSKFRTGVRAETLVDSVHMAAYNKKFIEKMKFNEKLIRSQDIEFNTRIRKAGGKILLLPQRLVTYFTRSNLKKFPADMFKNGFWVTRPLVLGCPVAKPRHYTPLIFVSALILFGTLGVAWSQFRLLFFFQLAVYCIFILALTKNENFGTYKSYLKLTFILFLLHFSYGLGSLVGLFSFIKGKK